MRVHVIVLLAAIAALLGGCRSSNVESVTGQTHLRVLAYNIHHGEGMDEVLDLERIAGLINDLNPDIVAIQEVDSIVDRTNGVDQIQTLAKQTGLTSVFGRFMSYQGGAYGMALLSRLPIVETENVRLPDGDEPRTALHAAIRTANGDTVDFVGIHFYRTEEDRLAQAEHLNLYMDNRPYPAILAGDFNSTPGTPVMEYLDTDWEIVQKGADKFTFPSTGPEREIDFVLYRPATAFLVIDQFLVDEPVMSDHRPVVVDLRLK